MRLVTLGVRIVQKHCTRVLVLVIDNFARTLELPLLVGSVILFFFLSIYLDRGLKDDFLVVLPFFPQSEGGNSRLPSVVLNYSGPHCS